LGGSVWALQKISAIFSGSNTGSDQRRRRAQRGLPNREARQSGQRMVGEAAAGEQQRAGAGCPQDGRSDLCRDDRAEDVNRICGS
jgi:hypothetical protein